LQWILSRSIKAPSSTPLTAIQPHKPHKPIEAYGREEAYGRRALKPTEEAVRTLEEQAVRTLEEQAVGTLERLMRSSRLNA